MILLLAAALRLVDLRDVPPGLAQDEVLDAGIAMLVRQGQHALFFREGFGHEPLYHYLAAPFAPLWGENVLSIRLPSVFLGLLLVALTMRWARRDFGRLAAAAAGLGLAISWWPIVFSRIGIRPILEPVLLVWAAWHLPRRPWLAGLFLGLSVYSYTPARAAFLIPALLFLYLGVRRRNAGALSPSQIAYRRSAPVVLGVALLVALPLYLTLRADPTLQQRVEQLQGPADALWQGDPRPILKATVATLAVFSFSGDPRWTYTLPGRPLFDPLTSLLFYGGLLLAASRAGRQPQYALALIWLAVTLLPSAVTPDAPSTVRMVGAMPVVYLLPALAAARLWEHRSQALESGLNGQVARIVAQVALPVLAGLLLLNLGRTVRDGFVRWPAELETRFRYQTVLRDIARHWQNEPVGTPVIADAFYEPIDHYSLRRNLGQELPDRWVQGGRAIIFPAGGNGRFYVPEFAPPESSLLEAAGLTLAPLYRSQARPSFTVYALPPAPTVPAVAPAVTFDGQVTLLGYQLLPRQGDEPLRLLTHWRVEAGPTTADLPSYLPRDLAIFVHLLDPAGGIVAQFDGLDAAASTLRPGDAFVQLHTLALPEALRDGTYALQMGLYVRGDGRRLAHSGQPSDRLVLYEALVLEGQ